MFFEMKAILINNIRYVDNTMMCTGLGLKININKTKFLIVIRNNTSHTRIHINEENTEQVTQFKYLVCVSNLGADLDEEIRYEIEQARTRFLRCRKFLIDKNLNFSLLY